MGKGEETRAAILDRALELARTAGLDGVTIGALADDMKMSKSGLFAHFQSKEKLQIGVLEMAAARFTEAVFTPALKSPRGIPRIRALFERWLEWVSLPGGCPFIAATVEYDDQPGPVREELVRTQQQLDEALRRAAQIAVEEGHFRKDLDPDQFAFQLHGILLAHQHSARLMGDPRAKARAKAAFDALVESARP